MSKFWLKVNSDGSRFASKYDRNEIKEVLIYRHKTSISYTATAGLYDYKNELGKTQ